MILNFFFSSGFHILHYTTSSIISSSDFFFLTTKNSSHQNSYDEWKLQGQAFVTLYVLLLAAPSYGSLVDL